MTKHAFEPVTFQGQTLALVQGEKFKKFFAKLQKGNWEPETFDFFRRTLDQKTVLIDVGGWIGVTSTWASKLAEKVIVVEPEPYCSSVIAETIELNSIKNVQLVAAALTDSPAVTFHVVGSGGSSESSLIARPGSTAVSVPGISVEEVSALAGDKPRVVKIDVEGYEYALGDKLCSFMHPQLIALQIALHPAVISREAGIWPFNRLRAMSATKQFIEKMRRCFGDPQVRGYSSVWNYLFLGILFSRKVKGTELEHLLPASKG